MLILSRKTEEEVIINSNIKVKIISVSENQVKIGIEAPKDVQIYRGEVYEKVKNSTLEASKAITLKADLKNYKIKKL